MEKRVTSSGVLQRFLVIGSVVASLVLGIYFYVYYRRKSNKTLSTKVDGGKLPFNGQYPIAPLNGKILASEVGIPPSIISPKKRDYGLFLLFNTKDKSFSCAACPIIEEEFTRLAKLVSPRQRIEKKVHFASIELKDNREVFTKLGVIQVPFLYYLPPTEKVSDSEYPKLMKNFDLQSGPAKLGDFITNEAKGIEFETPKTSRIYKLSLLVGVVLTCSLGIYLSFTSSLVQKVLFNYKIWSVICVAFVILMTSGHMWVRIRGAPYLSVGRDGLPIYIMQGMQTQLGIETQFITFLNGLCSLSLIALTSRSSRIEDAKWRRFFVYGCAALVIVGYSMELSMFRRKMGQYPFTLFIS